MNIYRYIEQNWGQALEIEPEKIFSISGFSNSWISRFLAFVALFSAVAIVYANVGQISLAVIALGVVFLVMSIMYAFDRRVTIDRDNDDVAFVQSLYGIPIHVHKATFDRIRRDTETGLLWSVRVIYAVTDDGALIPLFRGFSPSQQSTLDEQWTRLKEELPGDQIEE